MSRASLSFATDKLLKNVAKNKLSTPSTPSTDAVSADTNPALTQHSFSESKKNKSSNTDWQSSTIPQNIMASMIAETVADSLAWDHVNGLWYERPDRTIWIECPEPSARIRIRRAIERELGGFSAGYLNGVMTFLRDDLYITDWNTDRHLLPLTNGVLDMNTTSIRAYVPGDRFNWQLPYAYKVGANSPQIERIVAHMASGNQELIDFLYAWLYVVLTGQYELQKYLELIGPGGTGKSTYLKLAELLVGTANRAVTELKELEANRFESSALYGKRLTLVADSSQHRGEVSQLKKLTGGDAMRNEVKNRQQSAPFIYTGMVMVAANEPIQSSDYTSGLSRRRIPISFENRITDDDKARYPHGVEVAMAEEMPGLLNRLLDMDKSTALNTIRNPGQSVANNKLEIELETNPLLRWADQRLITCEPNHESKIGNKHDASDRLYPNYRAFCDASGITPQSIKYFSKRLVDVLTSHGVATEKKRKGSNNFLRGIRVRLAGDNTTSRLISEGLE